MQQKISMDLLICNSEDRISIDELVIAQHKRMNLLDFFLGGGLAGPESHQGTRYRTALELFFFEPGLFP